MEFEKDIKKLQCVGCVQGSFPECYIKSNKGIGCASHASGTVVFPIGKIFLGMPKGFCRLGVNQDLKMFIFKDAEQQKTEWPYGTFDMPVWKYLYGKYILIRGFQPRINCGFLHVILNGNISDYEGYRVTKKDIEYMD